MVHSIILGGYPTIIQIVCGICSNTYNFWTNEALSWDFKDHGMSVAKNSSQVSQIWDSHSSRHDINTNWISKHTNFMVQFHTMIGWDLFPLEFELAKTMNTMSTKIMYSLMHCSLNLAAECNSAVVQRNIPSYSMSAFFKKAISFCFSVFSETTKSCIVFSFKISSSLLLIFCTLHSSWRITILSFWSGQYFRSIDLWIIYLGLGHVWQIGFNNHG